MSSKNSLIQIPWPRRLNTDKAPSLLSSDETPVLKNVLTRRLPHEVRPRNGMLQMTKNWTASNYLAVAYGSTTHRQPYHAIISPDSKTMIVFNTISTEYLDVTQGNATPYLNRSRYQANTTSNTSLYNSVSGAGHVCVDLTGTNATPDNTFGQFNTYGLQAWGQPVYYDSCCFFQAAFDQFTPSVRSKYYDSTQTDHRRVITKDSYPIVWGGVNNTLTATNTSGTRLINATNGSATVTIVSGSGGPANLEGHIMTFNNVTAVGTNGMPEPTYQYQYRVRKDNGATIELDRPYGLGESTTNCPNLTGAGVSVAFTPWAYLRNAIPGGVTLAVFNDRMFSARGVVSATLATGAPQSWPSPVGEYGGFYGNAIFWSKPGNWNRWPDQNFAIVGQDAEDPITAMRVVGDSLVIFKATKTYVMTGYDEDSFQIDKISDVIGCPYPSGMTEYEGSLYFCNMDGVYAYSGEGLRCISAPAGGTGISERWAARSWHRTYTDLSAFGESKERFFWPTMAATQNGHIIVVCQPAGTLNARNAFTFEDFFVYDVQNDAWSEAGISTKNTNPVRVVTAPNGKVYGVHRDFLTDMTDVFNPAYPGSLYDQYPTGGVAVSANDRIVVPEVEVWFQPGPGNTVRLRECQIDHKCHYSAASSGGNYFAWNFTIGTDPALVLSSTQHSIPHRWVNSTGYVFTDPRYYSDRFWGTWQREAQSVRVKLTGTGSPTDPIKSRSLYALKFTVDTTRQMGIDNSTT